MVTVTQRPREQGPTDTVLAYPKHFLGQQVAVYIHARAHTHTRLPRALWASWERYTDDQGCQDQIDHALYLSRAHGSRHNGRPLLPIHVSASRRLQRFRVLGFSVKVQYIVSKSASSTAPVYCVSCACVCTRANTVCACPL